MAMYHVLDDRGLEVHRTELLSVAKRAADAAQSIALNGSQTFHVEKRERVWTTMTLDEAVKGTPADPSYTAPAN